MQKTNVVLVMLKIENLKNALACLNENTANLIAIIAEGGKGAVINFYGAEVPIVSFSSIEPVSARRKDVVWLISGFVKEVGEIYKIKKFLVAIGVPKDNIVNFEILFHISQSWIANIRYIEKNSVDYFATGISYIEAGLNLNCIPGAKGVNLANSNQDLRQGFLTAKYVFEHAAPGTIKFVLIGLTPYSLRYDNIKAFAVCPRNLQYIWTLGNSQDETLHGKLLKDLVSDKVKNFFLSAKAEQADLNFDGLKNGVAKEFPAYALVKWEDELKNLTKNFYRDTYEENLQILEDYIQLCLENGAKPVALVFPFAPAMHDNYDQDLLMMFRKNIRQLEKIYDFKFIDLFDLRLDYDCFYNMAHLNLKGSKIVSNILSLRLHEENILPPENLCRTTYENFYLLSNILQKDVYNKLMNGVFKAAAEKIRQKEKIKVGFVLYDSSMWCGDELYNKFAANERYEPKIFLCLRSVSTDDKFRKDFLHSLEQFKAKGLNVVGVSDPNFELPPQDIIFFLTPYLFTLPKGFQLDRITAETLLAYIHYGLGTSTWSISNYLITRVLWKFFFEMKHRLREFEQTSAIGMPRGVYSGHPKLDYFFEDKPAAEFEWKMTKPDAVKIIYAPHWSINSGIMYSTFQYNYQFMYEFAKNHPETSWVLKPHSNLLFSAVESGLFESAEEFQKYLQDWDDLPNAKLVTGGYYQPIFETSDGMILDSDSFTLEYQYTHKPIIFLTRDTQTLNELGKALMEVLYSVDGRDLKGIAQLMQKIFIEGKDELFEERMKFFDENLNYKKVNGMLASEYIFKTVADEFL